MMDARDYHFDDGRFYNVHFSDSASPNQATSGCLRQSLEMCYNSVLLVAKKNFKTGDHHQLTIQSVEKHADFLS